jgi:hypothetical protein
MTSHSGDYLWTPANKRGKHTLCTTVVQEAATVSYIDLFSHTGIGNMMSFYTMVQANASSKVRISIRIYAVRCTSMMAAHEAEVQDRELLARKPTCFVLSPQGSTWTPSRRSVTGESPIAGIRTRTAFVRLSSPCNAISLAELSDRQHCRRRQTKCGSSFCHLSRSPCTIC